MPASKLARTLVIDARDWNYGTRDERGGDGALERGRKGSGDKGERGRQPTPF
jgi:hypothetical protein